MADTRGESMSRGANRKNGREVYVRFFQDRFLYVATCLRPDFFVAWTRLVCHYVRLHGNVPDNDALLAKLAQLRVPRWLILRRELLELGVAEIRNGKWVDPDQDASLEIQERASEHGRRAIMTRWGKRGDHAA